MAYSKELQDTVDRIDITKDNILYLTLEQIYMQEMRDGTKDTEFREGSEFLLSHLFKRNKEKKFQFLKPKTHVLFQGGYNPDSPRLLIELTGFSVGSQLFPRDKELKPDYRLSQDVEIYLGKIVYDSLQDPDAPQAFKKAVKPKTSKAAPPAKKLASKKAAQDSSKKLTDFQEKRKLKLSYFNKSSEE